MTGAIGVYRYLSRFGKRQANSMSDLPLISPILNDIPTDRRILADLNKAAVTTHRFIQQSEDACRAEVQQFIRYIQSALRACIGLIEAARSAGMNPATEAQIVRSRIAPKNASGSPARTP
jgi:hypothetical protein